MAMLRTIEPKNARAKRALNKKKQENPCKRALFLRGTSCSQVVQNAMGDLYSMKGAWAKRFTKKNDIHPFEDAHSFEFFSEKNDSSMMVFGSSSKKRPHTITLARTFDHKILDMLEFHLDPESFRSIKQFKGAKSAINLRPLLLFVGPAFESVIPNEATTAKSLLIDFFRGESTDSIAVDGLQYMVVVTADDAAAAAASESVPTNLATSSPFSDLKPILRLRSYMIRTNRSGHKLPRVELEEQGPRMDFRLGRVFQADGALRKEAMKQVKTNEERTKKNVSTDTVGDKVGRIHPGKQDMSKLQTRKMKGLKRGRDEEEDGGSEGGGEKRRK